MPNLPQTSNLSSQAYITVPGNGSNDIWHRDSLSAAGSAWNQPVTQPKTFLTARFSQKKCLSFALALEVFAR